VPNRLSELLPMNVFPRYFERQKKVEWRGIYGICEMAETRETHCGKII
jgi:hypothetical protein